MNATLRQTIRSIFDELDMRQLEIFAHHTPTRRLQIMFDLCEFSRQMIIASERQREPTLDDTELAQRVKARIQLMYGDYTLSLMRGII